MDALYERLAARRQVRYGERLGEVPVAAQRHAHQAHVPSATAPFSGLARLRLRQQPVSAPRPLSHEPPARPPTCRRPAAQPQGAEAGVASAPVVPFKHPGAPSSATAALRPTSGPSPPSTSCTRPTQCGGTSWRAPAGSECSANCRVVRSPHSPRQRAARARAAVTCSSHDHRTTCPGG